MNQISSLAEKILSARTAYYNTDNPLVSDQEFDEWIDELAKLDPNNKAITMIGAEPTSKEWIKRKHKFPLGSLNKLNTSDEMEKWICVNAPNQNVLVAEKLDGLSIGVQYDNGVLTNALLRGGGTTEGEDILVNVLKMHGVVKTIPGFTGVIRGEIVLTKSDHQEYFPSYSNPRNAASGLCRRSDG